MFAFYSISYIFTIYIKCFDIDIFNYAFSGNEKHISACFLHLYVRLSNNIVKNSFASYYSPTFKLVFNYPIAYTNSFGSIAVLFSNYGDLEYTIYFAKTLVN